MVLSVFLIFILKKWHLWTDKQEMLSLTDALFWGVNGVLFGFVCVLAPAVLMGESWVCSVFGTSCSSSVPSQSLVQMAIQIQHLASHGAVPRALGKRPNSMKKEHKCLEHLGITSKYNYVFVNYQFLSNIHTVSEWWTQKHTGANLTPADPSQKNTCGCKPLWWTARCLHPGWAQRPSRGFHRAKTGCSSPVEAEDMSQTHPLHVIICPPEHLHMYNDCKLKTKIMFMMPLSLQCS